jgi:hypothetical protein
MKYHKVSLKPAQRKKWTKQGIELLKEGVITGFNLEDYNPNQKTALIYGHDNPKHLKTIRKGIGGKEYPRQSYYEWDKSWKLGINTVLINHRRTAKARERYIAARPRKKSLVFLEKSAVNRGKRRGHIPASWFVPDIRKYGRGRKPKNFKAAWLVTRAIDKDTRFATVITLKSNLRRARRELKGEKVKRIYVQNYKPKPHSFWHFVRGKKKK